MEKKLLKILEECNANRIDVDTAKAQVLDLFDVSKRHLIESILERMDGVFSEYH
jgi:choline dehydrogenase-like flavoprotein